MRVLQLTDDLDTGGLQRVVVDISNELVNRGHVVTVMARDGTLVQDLSRDVEFISKSKPRGILTCIKFVTSLRKYVKDHEIDIIHSHQRLVSILANWSVLGLNVRVIEHVHSAFRKTALAPISFRSRIIVACSEAVRSALVEDFSVKPSRITLIRNGGRDLAQYVVGESQSDPFTIGAVGRLVPEKDPKLFLEMCAEVQRLYPDISFVWVGDGPMRAELEESLSVSLGRRLAITGMVQDVAAHLKNIDLLVFSSRQEGLPIAGIEALSLSKPLAVTDVGSCNDLVANGNGIIFKNRKPEEMARELLDLVGSAEFALKGQRSRALFEDEFSLTKMTTEIVRLYERVLASSSE